MKKILSIFLMLLFSLVLVSCVRDFEEKKEYFVDFYYDDMILNSKTYLEGDLIQISDIEVPEGLEVSSLIDYSTKQPWNLTDPIKKDLIISVIFSELDIDGSEIFDIYYLNDTHGAVLKDKEQLGLSYISNFIKNDRDDNSIFITGGDIFQGQLISNDNRGKVMIEAFNEMNLDAFVIGNHEFDWGLDTILEYFNKNTSGVKANFPILGANIIDKRTGERPDFIDSHTIIERSGYKIGIIGVIGDGQESSILTPRVENYEFTNSYEAIRKTHNLIKNEVDFIIVGTHSGSIPLTNDLVKLDKVSAVLHGHNHSSYTGSALNNNHKQIPYIQSGSKGNQVGKVSLTFSLINDKLKYNRGSAKNITNSPYLNESDQAVDLVIDKYFKDIKKLYEEVLLTSRRYIGVSDLADYIARLMMETSNAVAGFQNSGGTRGNLTEGQKITASDIFEIFPFDNTIIKAEIRGSGLKQMLSDDYFFKSSNIDQSTILDGNYYLIATNDYIFYSNYNKGLFHDAINVEIVGDMYETWYQVMLKYKELGYKEFDTNLPIIYEG